MILITPLVVSCVNVCAVLLSWGFLIPFATLVSSHLRRHAWEQREAGKCTSFNSYCKPCSFCCVKNRSDDVILF